MTLAIILLLTAFSLVTLELMIPSFGLLSLMAACSYGFSIAMAFEEGTTVGWTFVSLGVVLAPVAVVFGIKLLPRTPLGRRLLLAAPTADSIQRGTLSDHRQAYLGRSGVTLTELRPAGTALFDNQKLDVVSDGPFIPKNTPVTMISIQGMRSVVKAQSPQVSTEQETTP